MKNMSKLKTKQKQPEKITGTFRIECNIQTHFFQTNFVDFILLNDAIEGKTGTLQQKVLVQKNKRNMNRIDKLRVGPMKCGQFVFQKFLMDVTSTFKL
jgi:hypothetical protein